MPVAPLRSTHHIFAALLLSLCTLRCMAADAGIDASLPDQFGNSGSLAAHRGSVVVAIVVDVRRLSTIQRWGEALGARYPRLHFLNIAQMPAGGPVDMPRVSATLQKRVPANVPVLIDVERRWATAYGLDTAAPNLLVFDRSGTLVTSLRGRFSAEREASIAPVIEKLLAQ
jgi:hypothetical protein